MPPFETNLPHFSFDDNPETASTLPAYTYFDRDWFELEKRQIFGVLSDMSAAFPTAATTSPTRLSISRFSYCAAAMARSRPFITPAGIVRTCY